MKRGEIRAYRLLVLGCAPLSTSTPGGPWGRGIRASFAKPPGEVFSQAKRKERLDAFNSAFCSEITESLRFGLTLLLNNSFVMKVMQPLRFQFVELIKSGEAVKTERTSCKLPPSLRLGEAGLGWRTRQVLPCGACAL